MLMTACPLKGCVLEIFQKKTLQATKLQSYFRTVEHNATSKGMQMNENKTKMICISAARSYHPTAFLQTTNNT